jgi:hypothetical protein
MSSLFENARAFITLDGVRVEVVDIRPALPDIDYTLSCTRTLYLEKTPDFLQLPVGTWQQTLDLMYYLARKNKRAMPCQYPREILFFCVWTYRASALIYETKDPD